jgi:ABC-type transport system substrate-binding protein
MDRRALFASATAAALLAATGVSATSTPRRGGRLRLALSGASRADTWTQGQGLFMQMARQGLVFDTLTEVAADGTLRGELATDWTASEDARAWRFTLRRDVAFHDGQPFAAADVVASAQGFEDGTVTATGSHQVVFDLYAPDPALPLRLAQPAFYISAAHAMGQGIGTGLYRVKHFTPGQRLLTERVSTHYKDGSAGWFDEVELTSIPSEEVRAQALREYLVDGVDVTDAATLRGTPDIALMPNDRRVAQAISTDVHHAPTVGAQRPFDNLRAAERWWFA